MKHSQFFGILMALYLIPVMDNLGKLICGILCAAIAICCRIAEIKSTRGESL